MDMLTVEIESRFSGIMKLESFTTGKILQAVPSLGFQRLGHIRIKRHFCLEQIFF